VRVVQDPTVEWISDSWGDGGAPSFPVLRIPLDYAVSSRPGTRFGPDAIVAALNGLTLYCTDKRVSLSGVRFRDEGEVDVVHDLATTYRRIADAVAGLEGAPIVLGGDHSITDPVIRGLRRRRRDRTFGIVVFDAHFDSRTPTPGKEHSGHWMKTIEDVVDYRSVAQVGINAPIYSAMYMRMAEERGVMVRTPYDARRQGWGRTIDEVIRHVSRDTDGAYLSVDVDVFDQAFAPGTSVPNPCGLHPHEVIDAVFEISRAVEIVGLDVVEVSPPLDRLDSTAQLAAHVVLNHVAGVVARVGQSAVTQKERVAR
jgi:agmatinase